MKLKIAASALLIAAVPQFALAQGQGGGEAPKPSEADVQKFASAIQNDKAKLKIYCDMAKAYEEASAEKDQKKAEELGKKGDDLNKQLGPDFEKLMAGLTQVDPESAEGKKLYAPMEALDNACKK